MNKEDIIRMARETGAIHIHQNPKEFAVVGNQTIERFAALVAAAEREACAKIVEQTKWSNWFQADCAASIRARGK